jgi:hypothetical protein
VQLTLAIAHSLADMYLDELRKPVEGGTWLACFGAQLYADANDPWWSEDTQTERAGQSVGRARLISSGPLLVHVDFLATTSSVE